MPKYINLESGFVFSNKKSIPLANQKILGIQSLTKYNQENAKPTVEKLYGNTFLLRNGKTNKILTMSDIMKMGGK